MADRSLRLPTRASLVKLVSACPTANRMKTYAAGSSSFAGGSTISPHGSGRCWRAIPGWRH